MQSIFTHENNLMVHLAKAQCEFNGIAIQLKHEHLQGSINLSPINSCLTLYLEDAKNHCMALRLLRSFHEEDEEAVISEWYCDDCGENNDPSFEWCWSCKYDRHRAVKHA